MKQSSAKKLSTQMYRHKQKRMSKMFYSESEPDFSNFANNSAWYFGPTFYESKSESDDSESDFNYVFMNLGICIFFTLYLQSSK